MKWIFSLIFLWLVFVVSLASWWLYFGVTTLYQVVASVSDLSRQPELIRHQRMLFMEGCVLLLFLIGGGLALFYFSYRMYKEKSAKEIFFASFTHDLKTALFRMQLEVEKLGQNHPDVNIENILIHGRDMHLNLENSLDSTLGGGKKIFLEKINFKDLVQEIHMQWPELGFQYSGHEVFVSDRRALHSIFKNLLHNSVIHGQADSVALKLTEESGSWVLCYSDNGGSFFGSIDNIGSMSHRTKGSGGGSGFGLYIVGQWVKRLKGKVSYKQNSETGALEVNIRLPREA